MNEHYPEHVLRRTRELYRAVRSWAEKRADVSIIGGWLVYEHVEAGRAQQSRDVDVALHSEDALREVLRRLPDWNLALRRKGRKTFPDAHFEDEAPTLFRLDLFTATSNPTWDRVFGRHGFQNIKVVPRVLLPGLAWAVEDKLATIPKRRGPDAKDKRAKDFIDIYHLVFHNREGMLPQELGGGNAVAREEALAFLQGARTTRSEYADSYEALERWLST